MPTGIASNETFGTVKVNQRIYPNSITSAEAFGTPTVTLGTVNIYPTGIASAEAFGTVKINQRILGKYIS